MEVLIINMVGRKLLRLQPENVQEAFNLGRLFGEYSEKINVASKMDGSLDFDLLPRDKEEIS